MADIFSACAKLPASFGIHKGRNQAHTTVPVCDCGPGQSDNKLFLAISNKPVQPQPFRLPQLREIASPIVTVSPVAYQSGLQNRNPTEHFYHFSLSGFRQPEQKKNTTTKSQRCYCRSYFKSFWPLIPPQLMTAGG